MRYDAEPYEDFERRDFIMDVANLALYGISLPSFIMITVGLAKTLGMPTKYAPHFSAFLGVGGGIAVAVTTSQPILWGIMAGVLLGALACGIYTQAKGLNPTV